MNDMVSLQKDVALISVLGPVEALRRASIEVARTFNFTPVRRRRRAVPLRVDPADPAHRPPPAARAWPHVDDGDPMKLQLAGRRQGLRRAPRARRHRPRRRRRRGDRPDRRVGQRQEHAAALRQPARADRRRAHPARRRRHQRARPRRRSGPAAHRAGVPELQPVPPPHRRRERRPWRRGRSRGLVARRGPRPRRSACSTGSGWPTRPTTTPTGCRAASSSAWPSPARWRWGRR